MIIIPYPATKKEIRKFNDTSRLFFRTFGKTFVIVEIVGILGISLIGSIFVPELKTVNMSELLGLMVGVASFVLLPAVILALFVSILNLLSRDNKSEKR